MTEIQVRRPFLKPKASGKFVMHDFQQTDLAWLVEQDSSANWSQMGCLKTSTAEWLWAAKTRHIPNPRVLVITTKSGKGTYFESIHEVLKDWRVFNFDTRRTMPVIGSRPVPIDVELPNPLDMHPVVVVTHYHSFTDRACIPREKKDEQGNDIFNEETGLFEMIIPRANILLRMHWDMIILDEAHRIKNQDTQWTRNIKKLKAQYKHIMTGTGFINNPAEIWSLLNFLYPKVYTSYWKLRERYCEEEEVAGFRKIVGIRSDTEQEFRDLVRRVGVRRTMLEAFPNIKEPIETVVPVRLNAIQQKMYNEIKEQLSTLDMQGVPLQTPNVLSMLNRLRQISIATPEVIEDYFDYNQERRIVKVKLRDPSSKLDALMDIIEGLEWDNERRDQIVVFSNYKDPIELAKKRFAAQYDNKGRLVRAAIPYLHMHAGMNDQDRYEMWHNTWPKKEHQVFICTLMIGSESINLTSAHRAVFLDQSWSPKDNTQAIGRVYRPGQTEACQLIYIRAEGTVDYRILGSNTEKTGWFKQIFGEGEDEDGINEEEA